MLEIENLHARVDGNDILKGLSLSVKPGEVHAIMGPNGLSLIHISEPTRPY